MLLGQTIAFDQQMQRTPVSTTARARARRTTYDRVMAKVEQSPLPTDGRSSGRATWRPQPSSRPTTPR
jgi:hypothetical protein